MAANNGNNSGKVAVKGRSQIFNPSTGNYVLKDTDSGKFIEVKSDGKPFKGVKKELVRIKANPNIPKELARQAESAVIKVKNRKISI